MALAIDPGMEVVGEESERETHLLRPPRVVDQGERPVFLARERVAELRLSSPPPPFDFAGG